MKNLLLISILIAASSAQADLAWVKTPFWRANYQDQQVLKIQAVTPLSKICADYSKLVYSAPGKSDLDAGEVETLRTLTDSIMDTQFRASFKVDGAASQALIQQSIDASQVSAQGSDALPMYTLPTSTVMPLLNVQSAPNVVDSAVSMTAISRGLGLKPLKIIINPQGLSTTIQVYGKDTACDLFSGEAHLSLDAGGAVKISLDDQQKVDGFYQQVEVATKNAFVRGKTPMSRIAILGLRLGEILSPLSNSTDGISAYIENLVDSLFDQNGDRNQVWSSFDSEPHLSVDGSANATFHVVLEK